MPKRIIFLLIILLLLPMGTVSAQNNSLRISVSAGYGGYAKQNTWMPVVVSAENTGESLTGEIRVQSTYPGETYAATLNLPAQSQKQITLFVPTQYEYSVEFVTDSGDTLFRRKVSSRSLAPFDFAVGIISDDANLLSFLGGLQSTQNITPVAVAHLSVAALPPSAAALATFDALIFNDVDTSPLTGAQKDALSAWIANGGKLVVGGGPNAGLTVTGLADLLPVSDFQLKTLPTLIDLTNFGRREIPAQGPYIAAVPQEVAGSIDLYEQENPFLVRQHFGNGDVIYFALDFGLAPMDGWAGNEHFWHEMLDPLQSSPPFYAGYDSPRFIYDALANIAVAGLPSPLNFTAFLCLYFVFLVPLNYWFLRRIKRKELAWLTIPTLILLFTLVGYIGGFRTRGRDVLLRQMDVVQHFEKSQDANIISFLGLYSPARGRFTLQFKGDNVLVQPTDGGNGGFDGVKKTSSAPTTVFYSAQTELRNLWTDVGTMSTAVAYHRAPEKPIDLNLRVNESGRILSLTGTIVNHGTQTLSDAILLLGEKGVPVGDIHAGENKIDLALQTIDRQLYNDTTLWGENYYNIDDVQRRLNDQLIKSIFWNDQYGPVSSGSRLSSDTIVFAGWVYDARADFVNVMGKSVSHNVTQLHIVSAEAGK